MVLSNWSTAPLLALLLAASAWGAPTPTPPAGVYKMCVPRNFLHYCNDMVAAVNDQHVHISCIVARDRLDCLEKIKSHEADFVPVDPEDLYIASRIPNQDFNLFKEIRTKEEPAEEFRYEAVAVIHKNLIIENITGLRGLKSCHTGIGRNVGYKIPITKLTNMGVLSISRDPNHTSRESELKALSQFFGQACLVGKWSPDEQLNQRLKARYTNLCALCENPSKCDYPDKYSGYDGALRCLSENGGDVAWTKVYYVKKHFGLGGREPTAVNADEYAYLCPDGSKAPMSAKPACTWAMRPWQGYLTNGAMANQVSDLRNVISQVNRVGESSHADWLKVLMLDNKTVAVDNKQPQAPQGYLDKAKYTDVIERNWGSPNPVRFCVTSEKALHKCRDLARAAWSRDIRPAFDCVREGSSLDCFKAIRDNGADIITVDAGQVYTAQTEFNLKPIMSERYNNDEKIYAVAVVKKTSSYQSLEDLRGAKSCHTMYGRTVGWNIPTYLLVSKSLSTCPHPIAKFFTGGSCAPGALEPQNNPSGDNPQSLCSICAGNLNATDPKEQEKTKCSIGEGESFSDHEGALRCLASGSGDVAFVRYGAVADNTDGKNQEPWAANLKSSDFELICSDGGRAPVNEFHRCNMMEVLPNMVVTRKSSTFFERDAIRHALLGASELYTKRPELFMLFGKYDGESNLLFRDITTKLVPIDEENPPSLEKHAEMAQTIKTCAAAH